MTLNTEDDVLIDSNVDINNTKVSFGTYNNNISASGKNISLLG